MVNKLVNLSLAWSLAIGGALWFIPITSSERSFNDSSHFGVLPLAIPILLSLLAVWSVNKKSRSGLWIASTLFVGFWLVSSLSIGLLYTPAVLLVLLTLAKVSRCRE